MLVGCYDTHSEKDLAFGQLIVGKRQIMFGGLHMTMLKKIQESSVVGDAFFGGIPLCLSLPPGFEETVIFARPTLSNLPCHSFWDHRCIEFVTFGTFR